MSPEVHRGVIVDIIVAGVAVVTIDGSAVVQRAIVPGGGPVDYPAPGSEVELGPGDVISYPAGQARTIVNPLQQTQLRFKRVLFFLGDVSPTVSGTTEDQSVTGRVIGDGQLPKRLSDYSTLDVVVMLEYIQVIPDIPLPEQRSELHRIVGPVDNQSDPGVESGFVLWVGESMG